MSYVAATWRNLLALWLLLCNHFNGGVMGSLFAQPNHRWTFTLDGGGQGLSGRTLRKGNAVVAHPTDGRLVFVTADDGSLHIIESEGEEQPTSTVFEPDNLIGKFTECRSGVSIAKETNEEGMKTVEYLVYAVVDVPIASGVSFTDGNLEGDTNEDSLSSRVIGVNFDGTLRWSVTVEGLIVGTPLVGSTGNLIYFSRNVAGKGYLSVVATDGESAELTASIAPADRDGPFGPAAIDRGTAENNGPNQNNGVPTDVIAVAESWGDGFVVDGGIYIVVPSDEFEDTGGRGDESYDIRLVNQWTYSAIAAPRLFGSTLFIGGTFAQISGWAGNRDLGNVLEGRDTDVDPRWSSNLDRSDRNFSQPLTTTPAITGDGSVLFWPGVTSQLACIQSDNGRQLWSEPLAGPVEAEPIVFERDGANIVYSVDSVAGIVRQHNIQNGASNWLANCGSLTGTGCDGVEAEFSLSGSGNYLYYGDIFGRIVAVHVASYETAEPTPAPSDPPTTEPTLLPSASPAPSSNPTDVASATPTISPTDLPEGATPAPVTPTLAPVLPPVPTIPSGPTPSLPTPAAPAPDPTGSAPTLAPIVVPPSVFDAPTDNTVDPNQLNADANEKNDGLAKGNIGLIAGAIFISLLVILAACVFLARYGKGKDEKGAKDEEVSMEIIDDVSDDLESGESPRSITATSDSVEVEVIGQSTVYSQKGKPRKKRKKSFVGNPGTPQTLESIEEDPEDAAHDDVTVELVDEDDSGEGGNMPAKNLNDQFNYVIEVQTLEGSSDDDRSYAMEVDPSMSRREALQGTPSLLSPPSNDESDNIEASDNEEETPDSEVPRTLVDDMSEGSDDSEPPPPPPMSAMAKAMTAFSAVAAAMVGGTSAKSSAPFQEEKKESDFDSTMDSKGKSGKRAAAASAELSDDDEVSLLNPQQSRSDHPAGSSSKSASVPTSPQSTHANYSDRDVVSPIAYDMSPQGSDNVSTQFSPPTSPKSSASARSKRSRKSAPLSPKTSASVASKKSKPSDAPMSPLTVASTSSKQSKQVDPMSPLSTASAASKRSKVNEPMSPVSTASKRSKETEVAAAAAAAAVTMSPVSTASAKSKRSTAQSTGALSPKSAASARELNELSPRLVSPAPQEEQFSPGFALADTPVRGTTATKNPAGSEVSPTGRSTASSLYLEESLSFDSTEQQTKAAAAQPSLSPLSPHVFSKRLDEDLPEDEAVHTNGAHWMLQPTLNHKYNSRTGKLNAGADDDDEDELMAPGSHYMSKIPPPSAPRGRNTLGNTASTASNSNNNNVDKGPPSKFGRSVRSKRNLTNFRPSLRGDSSSGSEYSPSDSESSSQGSNNSPGSPTKSFQRPTRRSGSSKPTTSSPSSRLSYQQDRPSFKRRSKRESNGSGVPRTSSNDGKQSQQHQKHQQGHEQEDHWSSFLNDLAAAEEKFFAPAHSQRSAILRYDDSDEDADPQIPAIRK